MVIEATPRAGGALARAAAVAERADLAPLVASLPFNTVLAVGAALDAEGWRELGLPLPVGDGEQSPDDFARQQSATTGLPEHMCRANMHKNHFVLTHMDRILEALTRGLDLDILARGWGVEARGVTVSYQAQSPVLGAVLPSNSPGVHTLWLPVIPMGIGLVLKPGPQEPWTPFRMAAAFTAAGVPPEAIAIYPGGGEMGAEVVNRCDRTMIFGGTPTVERYKGNPRVQVHGPGFSKIILGDDVADDWEKYLDLMADSVYLNSGRGCINCSGIWASRHTREIDHLEIDARPRDAKTAVVMRLDDAVHDRRRRTRLGLKASAGATDDHVMGAAAGVGLRHALVVVRVSRNNEINPEARRDVVEQFANPAIAVIT